MESKQKVTLTFALYRVNPWSVGRRLRENIIKVGRDPRSHLRIDDDQAARMHAVIEVSSPEQVTVIDLGNEPGTSDQRCADRQEKRRPWRPDSIRRDYRGAGARRAVVAAAAAGLLARGADEALRFRGPPVREVRGNGGSEPVRWGRSQHVCDGGGAWGMPSPFGSPKL